MRTILPVPGNDDVRQHGICDFIDVHTKKNKQYCRYGTAFSAGDVLYIPRIFYSNYYIRLSRLKSNFQKIQKSTVNDRRAGIHARTGGPVTRVSHSPSLNLAEVIILSLHHTMIIVK